MISDGSLTERGEKFLEETKIPVRLGTINNSNFPITTSLWYLYKERKIYCATINDAKIVEYLTQNNRCGFEIAGDKPPYKGIRGFGYADLDYSQGGDVLIAILDKYEVNRNSKLYNFLISRIEQEVAIIIKPVKLYSWDYTTRMKDAFKK